MLAAIILDGWLMEPDTAAIEQLRVCLADAIGLSASQAPSVEPAAVIQHRKALAEAVILHIG